MTRHSPSVDVALFAEDEAQRALVGAFVKRVATEEELPVHVRELCIQGGAGQMLTELRLFQRAARLQPDRPHLLVVSRDANCRGYTEIRRELRDSIDQTIFPLVAYAVPAPHVERWYMADPQSLHECLGVHVDREPRKCRRDRYKNLLRQALDAAGLPHMLDGAEWAPDIVEAMDLYRASKAEPSLGAFLRELRTHLRALKQGHGK